MRDGVGADFLGDLDLLFGDQRIARSRCRADIAPHRPCWRETSETRNADEFLAQILDENVLRLDAEQHSFLARGLELLALSEIGGGR